MYFMDIHDFNPPDTKPCIRYMCDTRCTLVGSIFVLSSAWNAGKL